MSSSPKRTRLAVIPVNGGHRSVSPSFEGIPEEHASTRFFGDMTRQETSDVLQRTNNVLQNDVSAVDATQVQRALASSEALVRSLENMQSSLSSVRSLMQLLNEPTEEEKPADKLPETSAAPDRVPEFVQFALNGRPAYQPGNVFLVCHDPEDTLFDFLFWQEPNVRNKYRTEEWYAFLLFYEEAVRLEDTDMFLQDYSLSEDEIRFLDLYSAAKKAKPATK